MQPSPSHRHPNASKASAGLGWVARVAAWSVAHRRLVLVGVLVSLVFGAVVAAGTMGQLQLARFAMPGSDSVRVAEQLAARGYGTPNLTLLVSSQQPLDDPAVVAASRQIEASLRDDPVVDDVFSYWSTDQWSVLRAGQGNQALIMARLTGDATQARQHLRDLSPRLSGQHGPIEVAVGGRDEIFRQAADQARADFGLAELIIIPGVLILLLLVLRRPVAALLTLGLGIMAVVWSMALVRGVAGLVEVSTFAANLILVMAVALGVDYGLFVIARYREARAAGQSIPEAAVTGATRAGSAVVVSAAAVCVALLALLLIPFAFLQSFSYAGIIVVACAVVGALVVLPALLALWGRWVDRPVVARSVEAGRFARVARRVMRRPLLWLAAGLMVVGLLGAPVLWLRPGPPDDRSLPPTASSRMVQERIRQDFPAEVADILTIVPAAPDDRWTDQQRATLTAALTRVPGVVDVVNAPDRGLDPAGPLVVVPATAALADDPYGLVAAVRAVPTPTAALVGGYPAELADFRDGLVARLPLVIAVMLVLSSLVLVVATRTIVLPLKAAILNSLSLSVLGGVLVWVFQDGHLASLVGVTATGSLDLSIPLLMLCLAFGLSMDYEVLMLSRIIEEHRAGATLTTAVARGLQRSAPLVSAAALILAASFLVYATSSISYLSMLGIGMALVVLVDATIIRLVLLPASMRLMGRANWWWPGRRGGRAAAQDFVQADDQVN